MKNHGTRYAGEPSQYDLIEKGGVVYIVFKKTGEWRPASKEVLAHEGFSETKAQEEARDRHMNEFLTEYRAAQSRRTPEEIAEEQAEIRAAFGPGQKIVNIVTGKITRT